MSTQPHLTCVWSDPADWDVLSASTVPAEPGYYAFTDHNGQLVATGGNANVLYVGIATQSLQERIRKYKTGDFTNINAMHRGGFMMFLSRATAHFGDGKLTHSVQRTPVNFTIKSAGQPPQHGVMQPQKIYLRWAVDYRAAIEALLIQSLKPKFNTMLVQD